MKVALTIAGSDSSAGAGIQADLKTFEAHGLFGVSAITAVTAQNTEGVRAIAPMTVAMVRHQLDALFEDFRIDVVKIGMLANGGIANMIGHYLKRHASGIPVILDPVMVSTSGSRLFDEDALQPLKDLLIPLSTVITPNIREAEAITGIRISNVHDMRRAALGMSRLGGCSIVVTGGEGVGTGADPDPSAIDLVRIADREFLLSAPRLNSTSTHGTGCTFASAVAANIALGEPVLSAMVRAKDYVHYAIASAPGIGAGHGPMRHSYGYMPE